MKFNIPLNKVEQLEKILNRAIKKGGAISCVKGPEVICDGELHIEDPSTHVVTIEKIKVRCIEVDVNGVYKINGWEFVGTIEHTPNGNIIRLANSEFEGKVPERYNHTACVCEHCQTLRNRKDTYLIYNSETGEFKQVGRNCLMEYTQGLDAEICAGIMSSLDKFVTLGDYGCDEDEFIGTGWSSSCYCVDSSTVKDYALALIREFGYHKRDSNIATVDDLYELLFEMPRSDRLKDFRKKDIIHDDPILDEITKYAESITDTFGYMYNAKIAWLNEYCEYRDFSLIASFIQVYFREQELKKQREADPSEYVGEIGQRILIKVADFKVISYNDMFYTALLLIKDEQGNAYIWSTGTSFEVGQTIKATVKAHEEYRGVKQTIITRGRIQE